VWIRHPAPKLCGLSPWLQARAESTFWLSAWPSSRLCLGCHFRYQKYHFKAIYWHKDNTIPGDNSYLSRPDPVRSQPDPVRSTTRPRSTDPVRLVMYCLWPIIWPCSTYCEEGDKSYDERTKQYYSTSLVLFDILIPVSLTGIENRKY